MSMNEGVDGIFNQAELQMGTDAYQAQVDNGKAHSDAVRADAERLRAKANKINVEATILTAKHKMEEAEVEMMDARIDRYRKETVNKIGTAAVLRVAGFFTMLPVMAAIWAFAIRVIFNG